MKISRLLWLVFLGYSLISLLSLVGINGISSTVWASQFYVDGDIEGDLNDDDIVDMIDFSIMLGQFGADCNEVQTCQGADLDGSSKVDETDLAILQQNWLVRSGAHPIKHGSPTRLTMLSEDTIALSDAVAGNVLFYNSAFDTVGTIEELDIPLGIAVDSTGKIYVGNNGRDNVEVYDNSGAKLLNIDDGNILMPVDLCFDRQDHLYVADALSDCVKVYEPNGVWLYDIGKTGSGNGELNFPVSVAIAYREITPGNETPELFVADQANYRIQVFDLQGNFKRTFGKLPRLTPVTLRWETWKGNFFKIQDIDFDSQGRLHTLDCYLNKVQILDPATGSYIDSYGSYGQSSGYLNLPLDILITPAGQVLVANTQNSAIEIFYTLP